MNTVDCCFSIWEASSAFPVLNHHGQFVVFDENTIFMMFSAISKIMCLTSALTSRKVTWLIIVPQDLVLSRCFRDRVEEHRDAKIFFIEEPNRYSISTLLSESDISLVDCFYQLVPYLWYWLISNSLKPGEVFIRRYDPDKYFDMPTCAQGCDPSLRNIAYFICFGSSRLTEFGTQDPKFTFLRTHFYDLHDHVLVFVLFGYKIAFSIYSSDGDDIVKCLFKLQPTHPSNKRGVISFHQSRSVKNH